MENSFIDLWISILRPIFPSNARIIKEKGNDITIKIDWKLDNDPSRPNRRSRLIRLVISEEAIEDCHDYEEAGHRLKQIVERRYAEFNPDHDNPREKGPPSEEWLITTNDLNK